MVLLRNGQITNVSIEMENISSIAVNYIAYDDYTVTIRHMDRTRYDFPRSYSIQANDSIVIDGTRFDIPDHYEPCKLLNLNAELDYFITFNCL